MEEERTEERKRRKVNVNKSKRARDAVRMFDAIVYMRDADWRGVKGGEIHF